MCTGFEIAALAVVAAGSYMSYEAQQDAAEENKKAAERSYNAQMQQLQEERSQINQNAGEKMSEVARVEQAKMAQLRVAAGESGVSGVSVDRVEQEINMDASQDMASIEANRRNSMNQTRAQAAGIAAQAINQANSVKKPYWGAAALQIAGAGLNAYDKQQTRAALTKQTSGLQTG